MNVTEIVQLAPADSVALPVGHVFVWAKSPGSASASEMSLIDRSAFPVLVNVTDCGALAVPNGSAANAKLVGLRPTVGAGATPLPLRLTVWGVPTALSLTVRLAVRDPEAVGPNVTTIVQLPPAASVALPLGHVSLSEKSPAFAPVTPILLIVSAAVPELVNVTVRAPLVDPTNWFPNETLVGVSVTAGAGEEVPWLNALRMLAVVF
jgi:hypothetical protein